MHPLKSLPLVVFATLSIAPVASAAGNGALDRTFAKTDIDKNGVLDPIEFLALQARSKTWTDTTHRFKLADVDDNDLLTLTEFRASNGGKEGGKPGKSETFLLADLDLDGSLDPVEYARTISQGKPWRKVLRDFAREDHDDSGLLSPQEFGGTPFPL